MLGLVSAAASFARFFSICLRFIACRDCACTEFGISWAQFRLWVCGNKYLSRLCLNSVFFTGLNKTIVFSIEMQGINATPTPMPRAAQRRFLPEAAEDIEYSTSEDEDESSSSTATSSTAGDDDRSSDAESSAGDDEQPSETAAPDDEVADSVDGGASAEPLPQPTPEDDAEVARKRKALNEPPEAKVPRLDAEQSGRPSEPPESDSSESSESVCGVGESAESEGGQPDQPQKNNSSCAEPLAEAEAAASAAEMKAEADAEADAPPAVEEPLALEKVSAGSYQFARAVRWTNGAAAVASSRARITNAKGEQLSQLGGADGEAAEGPEDADGSGSSGSEA
uniref:RanBD1 domain-containing protein n=1 Tax=Macrostomum lignano TaxID=282301 RepID=A0A1I8FXH3_9PLAT